MRVSGLHLNLGHLRWYLAHSIYLGNFYSFIIPPFPGSNSFLDELKLPCPPHVSCWITKLKVLTSTLEFKVILFNRPYVQSLALMFYITNSVSFTIKSLWSQSNHFEYIAVIHFVLQACSKNSRGKYPLLPFAGCLVALLFPLFRWVHFRRWGRRCQPVALSSQLLNANQITKFWQTVKTDYKWPSIEHLTPNQDLIL